MLVGTWELALFAATVGGTVSTASWDAVMTGAGAGSSRLGGCEAAGSAESTVRAVTLDFFVRRVVVERTGSAGPSAAASSSSLAAAS